MLNLVNSSWGLVQTTNPVVQLFRVYRREPIAVPGQPSVGELRLVYIGGTQRDRETGEVRAARPLAPEVPSSQWRAQIGLRLSAIR
ncbi:MAG: hypothetical protein J4F34_06940 [Gemmatimonadetes bacterium]|nr:hypothetical protein [Gemmatimonadota bacterium]